MAPFVPILHLFMVISQNFFVQSENAHHLSSCPNKFKTAALLYFVKSENGTTFSYFKNTDWEPYFNGFPFFQEFPIYFSLFPFLVK